jgi:hypothetical protein
MYRVRKDSILDRGSYEYFAALKNGDATWTKDIDGRGVVHTFPSGWVNRTMHPYAWHPSLTYNEPLGVYMMANWGMGTAPDGMWFGKPSYLGFWVSSTPWGPWEQIHEETSWTPGDDADARCYQPQIAPKWIAADGKSFWLVWTDFQATVPEDELNAAFDRIKTESTSTEEYVARREALMPYYAFNVQRVDLTVA